MWFELNCTGLTPLGTSLDQKILQPLLLSPARQNSLQKPLLIIAITDGQSEGVQTIIMLIEAGAPAGEANDTSKHFFSLVKLQVDPISRSGHHSG